MKNFILKLFISIISIIFLIILYLSLIGLETEKFNSQIKDKVTKSNKNLEIELKKIKLTLDPFKFKLNVKTVGTNIIYRGKSLELEYIKTQISLVSLIKNKFIFSNLDLSTRSILLRDLVTFIRMTSNKPEIFDLESAIKKGQVIANVKLNFDENGKIKKDLIISGILKDGKIGLSNIYNFEKINFLLDVKDNILNFKDVSFTTNQIEFFSDNLKIIQNDKDFLFKGEIKNQNTTLNNRLLKLLNLEYLNLYNTNFNSKYLNLYNTNFNSKNIFSFNVNNKFKIKNLVIDSEIQINKSDFKKFDLIDSYTSGVNDLIYIKDHKIKTSYKKNNLTIKGTGKIKLTNKFDEIKYIISNNNKNLKIDSSIALSELKLKNREFLKIFFPNSKKLINLKNQKIKIDYNNNHLSVKGNGKIKLEKEFDEINFHILKNDNQFNFETQINLYKTLFIIDFLNFKKNSKLKTQLKLKGNYDKKKEFNFSEISLVEKNNEILIQNLLLDKNNLVIKVDKVNSNYLDNENKDNKFSLIRKKKNEYLINGSSFNANRLINNLLKNKKNNNYKILKEGIKLSLDIKEVFISDKDIVTNFKGKMNIEDSKITKADIFASFNEDKNLTFTINTNNGEKITTFYSSRAEPIVKKYKFIKGFEDGSLDFLSSKKNKTSQSTLKIYNFKLQELPALTKLLTLASLQGIADTLSGEGIRFNEFEMNFKNKDNLMTIDEIYAIGPAISILMKGYAEEDKIISLRGTLVPATTLNKTIGSIPFLGKILVGDKIGEGVFGVSFKIKGPPNNLETTVNPIKTLTPRFITRTLEKIKKN